jgi:hypothetical protein
MHMNVMVLVLLGGMNVMVLVLLGGMHVRWRGGGGRIVGCGGRGSGRGLGLGPGEEREKADGARLADWGGQFHSLARIRGADERASALLA